MLLDQSQLPLAEALYQVAGQDHVPFFTPGHKRGQGAANLLRDWWGAALFQADLPELPGLDNLFAPQGAIAQAQALAAAAFGADHTWFLANGSTSGVIAAILATCGPGDKIILPCTVHKSAISGLILSGAMPVFLGPEYDPDWDLVYSVTPQAVAEALAHHPEAKALLLVSPTYQGVCGDGAAIATLAHQAGIPLLVDEAHGPHFAFHPSLPASALSWGADLVVQSTHKVLSSLTQSAMVHTQGPRIDPDRLRRALQLIQSTSPSYLLLASLDAARHQMATQGHALMQQTLDLADEARAQIRQIPGFQVFSADRAGKNPGFAALDPTRLTVQGTELGFTGFDLDTLLSQQWGITAELPLLRHLTFIISLGNSQSDMDRLIRAFRHLSQQYYRQNPLPASAAASGGGPRSPCRRTGLLPPLALSPRQAYFAPTTTVPIDQGIGHISAELVCPYPPGIPVLMPGEIITPPAIAELQQGRDAGGIVIGCADATLKTLKVIPTGV